MEEWEQMDKPLYDLLEIIHFAENVAARIHGLLDEAEVYKTVKEEFTKSKRYDAGIFLLTEKLRYQTLWRCGGEVCREGRPTPQVQVCPIRHLLRRRSRAGEGQND